MSGRRRKKDGGFTLVELAICMIITSLALTGFLRFYVVYKLQENYDTTKSRLADIETALGEFLHADLRLPCPAPINAAADTRTFAREGPCDELTANKVAGLLDPHNRKPGTLALYKGLIIAPSEYKGIVVMGRVPSRTLNLKDNQYNDAWGHPMTYAVTLDLTSPATYSQAGGALFVGDANGNSVTTPDGSAQYVLVAHGQNGNILAHSPCAHGELDDANCNGDASFMAASLRSAPGKEHFDDLVSYAVRVTPTKNLNHFCVLNAPLSESGESIFRKTSGLSGAARSMAVADGQIVTTCADHIGETACRYLLCRNGQLIQAFLDGTWDDQEQLRPAQGTPPPTSRPNYIPPPPIQDTAPTQNPAPASSFFPPQPGQIPFRPQGRKKMR